MQPRFETLHPKKLVGRQMKMSLVHNKTGELWHSFKTRRKEIVNSIGSDLYSMQVYGPDYFKNFNPATEFTKWAGIEVEDFDHIPDGMESIVLPGGLYAVFLHKGPASSGPNTFQYIYGEWIPNSDYELDDRPHFEILGARYKNESPDSEEEVWIP